VTQHMLDWSVEPLATVFTTGDIRRSDEQQAKL
jgi:hypothetical protein